MIQIIIPVYNAAKTVPRCLDSVKAQTEEDWRAILVDDASEDDSLALLETYAAADSRFTVLRHTERAGAAAARNTALAQLSGEYVAFLDADDYWEPDMLGTLLRRAKEQNCDVVQCRFSYDFPGGRQVVPKGAFAQDKLLCGEELKQVYRRMMTGINMNHVCMKLIRTDRIGTQRFDTELPTAEDLRFCVELFRKVRRYGFVNRALYHYCRTGDSVTGRGLSVRKRFRANRKVSGEMLKALPAWGMDTLFYRGLTRARPYTIMVSKLGRMAQEKLARRR